MVLLDCRVAALLAMAKGRTGMGEVVRVPVFGRVIASPLGRGNPVSSLFVIARKVSKRTDVAIQSEA
jgi:hypothetical protein